MFRKTKELQSLVEARTIERLEKANKELKEEVEYEHLENYDNHSKLLRIQRLLRIQDYNSATNLKNKIRTILKKESVSDFDRELTNSK